MSNQGKPGQKTLGQYFRDWEHEVFGFGYGTGEAVILPLLRRFFAHCDRLQDSTGYDYSKIENDIGKASTWFLINAFCKDDIIEYGSSPRFGWLTDEGKRLKDFVMSKTDEELYNFVMAGESVTDPGTCYKNTCNCGPGGYQEGVLCANPFWANGTLSRVSDKDYKVLLEKEKNNGNESR